MATQCFTPVRGHTARVTRVDSCGRPLYGECAQVVTDGIVTISLTANIDEGEEITVTNFAGRTCVSDQPCPTLNSYTAEVQFCDVDPDIFNIMTGKRVVDGQVEGSVTDRDGNSIGFGIDGGGALCDNGFALEIWTGVYSEQGCEDESGEGEQGCPAGEGRWGYILLPFMQGGTFGDFEIGNAEITFSLSNAATKTGNSWGTGPYDIQCDGDAPGGLFDPVPNNRHVHVQTVDLRPPEAMCGCQPLEEPPEIACTGATEVEDAVGTWTPGGCTEIPADLAAMNSIPVVADPATAWGDGSYMALGDGSLATWDGSGWIETDIGS